MVIEDPWLPRVWDVVDTSTMPSGAYTARADWRHWSVWYQSKTKRRARWGAWWRVVKFRLTGEAF